MAVSTETDPWVNVPKQELNLQEVQELEEENKEIANIEQKPELEENVELNLEEQNIEDQQGGEVNDLYASNDLIKVRDDFIDSINNSALMEIEKQREENLLSERENEKESIEKTEKPSKFGIEEEEDIKEHK